MFKQSITKNEYTVELEVKKQSTGYSLMLFIVPGANIQDFTKAVYSQVKHVVSWSSAAVDNGIWFSFSTSDIADITHAIRALKEHHIADVVIPWEKVLFDSTPYGLPRLEKPMKVVLPKVSLTTA